jgi:predicted RNA binding protein YcfA (HicA-like mRNA interferase family)
MPWAVVSKKVRDLVNRLEVKRLEQDGWRIARTKGSHPQFLVRAPKTIE